MQGIRAFCETNYFHKLLSEKNNESVRDFGRSWNDGMFYSRPFGALAAVKQDLDGFEAQSGTSYRRVLNSQLGVRLLAQNPEDP